LTASVPPSNKVLRQSRTLILAGRMLGLQL